MNKEVNEFLIYKTLKLKHGFSSAIDLDDYSGDHEIKNVCTKMSKELSDRIDSTIKFLDIRKRKFVEMAIIQALDNADEVIGEYLIGDEDWIESQQTKGEE